MPLPTIARRIEACAACPRLVRHRELIARTKRRAYASETYHGRPVAGFGDPAARIVIVGLAPGAHGANRTGRVFTGDRSGDFLYAALCRAHLANQPTSTRKDDGLQLRDVFITLAVRCVPPDNMPKPAEIARCASFLDDEIAVLPQANVRVFLALGAIAFEAVLGHAKRNGLDVRARFTHGAEVELGARTLLASYHVSQQNTQTGRLTQAMFDAVVARAKKIAECK